MASRSSSSSGRAASSSRNAMRSSHRLLDLAQLGALQVADLSRQALQPRARQRDRLQQLGVAVARDDLGGDRLALQAQTAEHALFELR